MSIAIEVDQPDTWPREVLAATEDLWWQLESSVDLSAWCDTLSGLVSDEAARRFEYLVAPNPVRLYHATRLLPHERANVTGLGLQPATRGWHIEKLRAAANAHPVVLDESTLSLLAAHGPLNWSGHEARLGTVCLAGPFSSLTSNADLFSSLLGYWGGESTYWVDCPSVSENRRCREVLRRLTDESVPTFVEVRPLFSDVHTVGRWWVYFVAAYAGMPGVEFELRADHAVEAHRLIQPGDPDWSDGWLTAPDFRLRG